MNDADTEIAVVGAGVLGLSVARSLARRGRPVVVYEQSTVGHDGSGSKGSIRIFRHGYDDPAYVRLALVAERLWQQLESETGVPLLTVTGQLTFGDDLDVLAASLDAAGAPAVMMPAAEVAERFPAVSVPGAALYEPRSGVIAAADCLAALGATPGVDLRSATRVAHLDEDGGGVRLTVTRAGSTEVAHASVVVVCAGPATAPLLAGRVAGFEALPTLEQVAYLVPAAPSSSGDVVDHTPVIVERRRPWFYGLPDRVEGRMKIALHGSGPALGVDDLYRAISGDPDEALVAELSAAARRVLPGYAPVPVATERCVYDNTPDGDFVIDRIGSVVIGAGTSGHGFKFAPLLGELLADLATGTAPPSTLGAAEDIARFRAGRLPAAAGGGGPTVHP